MANTLFNQKSSSIKVNIGSSGGVVGSTLSANAVTLTNTAAGKKKIAQMEDGEQPIGEWQLRSPVAYFGATQNCCHRVVHMCLEIQKHPG